MEKILLNQRNLLGQCRTHLWSIDASNICNTHETLICNMCSSIFHFDWELEIKNGATFVLEATDTMKRLTEMIEYQGTYLLFDRVRVEFKDEIKQLKRQVREYELKITQKRIHVANAEELVNEARSLTKEIMKSHLYDAFIDYISKMKIWRRVSSFLDDQSKFSLHQIRTQFVLDVKKKEAEFWEGKLMGLAQEMIKRFDNHKERIKARYTRFKEWWMQNIEDQIQDMVSKFNLKMKDELTKIQTHFDDQEKMIWKLENEMKQQNSELKKQIDSGKKSTNEFISKQEKFNLNQNKINKDTENKLKEQANQIVQLKKIIQDFISKQEQINKDQNEENKNFDDKYNKQDNKINYIDAAQENHENKIKDTQNNQTNQNKSIESIKSFQVSKFQNIQNEQPKQNDQINSFKTGIFKQNDQIKNIKNENVKQINQINSFINKQVQNESLFKGIYPSTTNSLFPINAFHGSSQKNLKDVSDESKPLTTEKAKEKLFDKPKESKSTVTELND